MDTILVIYGHDGDIEGENSGNCVMKKETLR